MVENADHDAPCDWPHGVTDHGPMPLGGIEASQSALQFARDGAEIGAKMTGMCQMVYSHGSLV